MGGRYILISDGGMPTLDGGMLPPYNLSNGHKYSKSAITDFELLIMIVTVFCKIFLEGPVLIYLKLNATSIHLIPFSAKLHSLLFNIAKDLQRFN